MIDPRAVRQKILKGPSVTYRYGGPGPYTTPAVNCSRFNAVAVRVTPPTGTSIKADVHVQGGHVAGSLTDLHDPNAVKTSVSTAQLIDVVVGQHFVAVNLVNLGGVIDTDQAWEITITPYSAPGQSRVVASVG